jgi:hypothetical protein
MNLRTAVAAASWPTPSASNPNEQEPLESWLARREALKAQGKNGNGMGMPLGVAVRLESESARPTPTVKGDYNKAGLSPRSGDGLATAVTKEDWGTPTARDWKDGDCRDQAVETNGLLGRQVVREPEAPRGALNPDWVELLMGFPVSWTRVGPPAVDSPSTSGNRRARSRLARIETEAAA